MAFRTYSFYEHGVPTSDARFNPEDTYVSVISHHRSAIGAGIQQQGLLAIRRMFNVLYEGPIAYNHFHKERGEPCQQIIIFEKKCPQELSPAPSASPKAVILGETI
jgi:hypothetical protein